MIDLSPNHLATVKAVLAEHVPDCEVRAFDSRATWTARDYSDLELAVVGERPLHWRTLARLGEAFEESRLSMRVDVLDWHAISQSFQNEIERESMVVQKGARQQSQPTSGEWQMCTLGELTDNFDAVRIPVKQRDRRPGPYPYYGASGTVDHVDGFLFDGEYLLIAEDGENLRTRTTPIAFLAQGKFWVNNHAHIVQGNRNADTRFLKYALSGLDISGYLTGSTMPKLTQGNMNRISLLTPPLPEQRAIAHVLGILDDKIELNRRMNETLEAMARVLFKSWFVDFDPVRAKMEGRWRCGESLPGLPADLYDLFSDRLVDSELGEIPEGWGVKALGDCFNLTMGQSPPGSTYNDDGNGTPFYQGSTDFGERYPTNRRHCTEPARWAQTEDTLVSVRAPVGEINRAWERCCIGRGVAALRHKSGSAPYTYYAIWAAQSEIGQYEHTGTVFGAIGGQQFKALLMLEPPEETIAELHRIGQDLDRRIRSNVAESRALAMQRDAALPKLVSGEARVGDVT